MKRVIVIGSPGAGKSTLARNLRDRTGLPLYHLDNIWHKPDRTTISREEFDERLNAILAKDSWIIDGNYPRGRFYSDTSIYSPCVIICKCRVFHHHIIIREQEFKVFSFRIYIKRDPADERVVRPEYNFLKAIFIQGRLKDLIAFFVMPKERDQFAVFHTDAVGIQANVVPELVVFGKKFIDQSKLSFIGASIGDADLKGNLLKVLLKAALIGHALHIIDHLIRLYFFAIEDDIIGQSIQTGVQFATFSTVFANAFDANAKADSVC